MKYAIANYFSLDARRSAARALYVLEPLPDIKELALRTAIEKSCPIAVMLLVDGYSDFGGNPLAIEVATTVRCGSLFTDRSKGRLWEEAKDFISDWDTGRISDLFEALDVPRLGG